MKKLCIIVLLNICALLWHTDNSSMDTSSHPRPASQLAEKKLTESTNSIAITSSQSTDPSNTVLVDKNIINMSSTLMGIWEDQGLDESLTKSITLDLFSANTVKSVLTLLQNYYDFKKNPKNTDRYTAMQNIIEQLSLEQSIDGANMLEFLNINDSECPLMNMFIDQLANVISNLSPNQVSTNKELINQLNSSSSELLSKKIISFMQITILKHHGIRKENILPEAIKLNWTVDHIAFSNDGKHVALTYDYPRFVAAFSRIFIFDVETGKELAILPCQTTVTSIKFSHDDTKIISTHDDNQNNLIIWDATNYTQLDSLIGHAHPALNALFGPNDETIISASQGNHDNLIAWKWNANTGKYTKEESLIGRPSNVRTMSISHNGKHIISESLAGSIIVYRTNPYAMDDTLKYDKHKPHLVSLLQFSPDDDKFIALYDKGAALWNTKTHAVEHFFPSKKYFSAAFNSDSNILALAQRDHYTHKPITLWHILKNEKICEFNSQQLTINSIHFINNGNTLAIAAEDRKKPLVMVNLFTAKEQETFDKLKKQSLFDQVRSLSFYAATQERSQKAILD